MPRLIIRQRQPEIDNCTAGGTLRGFSLSWRDSPAKQASHTHTIFDS